MSNNSDHYPERSVVFEKISAKKAIWFILGLSTAAILFLFWLIYFKDPAETSLPWVKNLSAVNAGLNSVATVLLIMGFREIKKKNYRKHMRYMMGAFVASALFLVSYIVYHHFAGDTPFTGQGFIRPVYFFILITHIVLSVVVVPLVLTSFFYSLSGRFEKHKKISRWTFPVWLYVSVTGVMVFVFLRVWG